MQVATTNRGVIEHKGGGRQKNYFGERLTAKTLRRKGRGQISWLRIKAKLLCLFALLAATFCADGGEAGSSFALRAMEDREA